MSTEQFAAWSKTYLTDARKAPGRDLGRLLAWEAVPKEHAHAIARSAMESDFHAGGVATLECRPYRVRILLLE